MSQPPASSGHDAPPPNRRIERDLRVQGTLRIGDHYRIDGDVIAPGGLILGADVIVRGDVYTDGEIEMGQGSRIDGTLHGTDGTPASATSPAPTRPDAGPSVQGQAPSAATGEPKPVDPERIYETVRTTLMIVWDLLCDTPAEHLIETGRPMDMEAGALEDLLEGMGHLLARTYAEGPGAEEESHGPWSVDELISVLYQRVMPMVLPLEVSRLDPQHATVELHRPPPLSVGQEGADGWPIRALILLDLLTGTLRPGTEVEFDDALDLLEPHANPDTVRATVWLGEDRS